MKRTCRNCVHRGTTYNMGGFWCTVHDRNVHKDDEGCEQWQKKVKA